MASQLKIIIDALWQGRGQTHAARGDIQELAQSTEHADIRMAAMGQRSSLLQGKMKELGREVTLGSKTVEEATSEYKKFEGSLVDLGDGAQKGGASLRDLVTGAAKVTAVVGGVAIAARAAWRAFEDSAELELAERRFDRLSESIGTTGDALESDLRRATRGLLSDAQAVELAGDLMALGLAKTSDQATRLTNVAAQLGMNINQLVLTLTNRTTARFDQLGVSVDGFEERLKSLEAQGLSTEEAFSEAFLRQAEEQIEKVGSIADTSAGKAQVLKAAWANTFNELRRGAGGAIGPIVEGLAKIVIAAGNAEAAVADLKDGVHELGAEETAVNRLRDAIREVGPIGNIFAPQQTIRTRDALRELAVELVKGSDAIEDQARILRKYGFEVDDIGVKLNGMALSWVEIQRAIEQAEKEARYNRQAQEDQMRAIRSSTDAVEGQSDALADNADAWEEARASLKEYDDELAQADVYEARREGISGVSELLRREGEAAEEARQKLEALNEERRRIVSGAIEKQGDTIGELADAYGELQAAGGGMDQLYADDVQAATEAQQRIDELNTQIAQNYNQMVLDILLADHGLDQQAADWAVRAGLMTQAQADMTMASEGIAGAISYIAETADEKEIDAATADRFIRPLIEALQDGDTEIEGLIDRIVGNFDAMVSGDRLAGLNAFDETTQRMVGKLEEADRNAGLLSDTVGGMDTSALHDAEETSGSLHDTLSDIRDVEWYAEIDYQSVGDALNTATELAAALDRAARNRTATINVEYNQRGNASTTIGDGPTPGVPEYASGTNGVERVPGPAGQDYLVRLHGGEPFWVGRPGEEPPGRGGGQTYQDNRQYNLFLPDAGAAAVAAAHLDAEASKRWDEYMGVRR